MPNAIANLLAQALQIAPVAGGYGGGAPSPLVGAQQNYQGLTADQLNTVLGNEYTPTQFATDFWK